MPSTGGKCLYIILILSNRIYICYKFNIFVINNNFSFSLSLNKKYLRYSADENTMNDDTIGVVLEEAEIVDCDAEVEADDDNVQYHLYAINRGDNTVAYKVMQVSNNHRENNEVSIATPVNNTVQVLGSSLNGQLYVLSNGSDVASESARAVTPRVTKLQIEGSQNIVTNVKKVIFFYYCIAFYYFSVQKTKLYIIFIER